MYQVCYGLAAVTTAVSRNKVSGNDISESGYAARLFRVMGLVDIPAFTHLSHPLFAPPSGSVVCPKVGKTSANPTRQHHQQGGRGADKRYDVGTKRRDDIGGSSGRGGGGSRGRGLSLDTSTNSPMTRRQRRQQQQQQQQDSFAMEEESQIVTYGEQYNPATGWTR